MHPPVSAERWAAMRALREGKPPTFPLLAAIAELHVTTIRCRASRELWGKPPKKAKAHVATAAVVAFPGLGTREGETPDDRLRRLSAFLTRQVEEIVAEAETVGGAIDKERIDGLTAMLRMMERSEALMPARAARQAEKDGELADILRRIDDRIVELARYYAGQMGGDGGGRGEGGADRLAGHELGGREPVGETGAAG